MKRIRKYLAGWLSASALLLLAFSATSTIKAQPVSPVGTWDTLLSGHRTGVAYIQFAADNTMQVMEVLVPNKVVLGNTNSIARNDTAGRGPGGGSVNLSTNQTPQLFGGGIANGQWGFDTKGQVIGFFVEDTNSVSFVGKVTSKSIILNCKTQWGKSGSTTYKGVLFTNPQPDISGSYYAKKTQDQITYVEFFTMTPDSSGFPNVYNVSLTGPGYTYSGMAILSSQKRLAFALNNDADPLHVVGRAVTGPFNPKKVTANTQGWDQQEGPFISIAHFNVVRSGP